jgi:uncharacterized membrane-anchored protein
MFPAFILMALAQLFVPTKMIWQQESILREGEAYKFLTAPIDPYDPFRGRYVALSFQDTEFEVPAEKEWTYGQELYLSLTKDNDNYAKVGTISETEPQGSAYVRVKVANSYSDPNKRFVMIQYPFDRFYMDEFKAYEAELGYREVQRDTTQKAYALVKIKDGQAVLENVFINDIPLAEVARQRLANPQGKDQ